MGEVILETRKLPKEFGGLVTVDDASILVRANTFHAIIGPKGAGKTTFFNLVSGILEPTSGWCYTRGATSH
jgi:ABC-type branched-subunit amino acid transport system ATPase component